MSVQASTSTLFVTQTDSRRRHQLRLLAAGILLGAFLISIAIYGLDYYLLDSARRPFSPKHSLLRPSGAIGLRLGQLGFLLFLGLYLYPIRKRWPWLAKQGNTRHWLDVHVLLGLAAPLVIAFHSSFKFRGIAGVAFWIMFAVALSGVVGRYLFAQIPRSLTAAELSLKEMQELRAASTQRLTAQKQFSPRELEAMLHLPDETAVRRGAVLWVLGMMLALDVRRKFHIAALRRRALDARGRLHSLNGLLPSHCAELENVIRAAREHASLSKRILFLSRSQQVFHLWHVVHRPFSYSFSVLAALHIVVVMLFGMM